MHLARRDRQRRVGPVGEETRTSRSGSSSPDLEPEDIVDAIDFRYIEDGARRRTRRSTSSAPACAGKASASGRSLRDGYPAYTTSAGWLGYDDEKVEALVRRRSRTACAT